MAIETSTLVSGVKKMTTRVTAYNERGGVISTWNIEHNGDVYDQLLINAERDRFYVGFAVDGFGMVSVKRNSTWTDEFGNVFYDEDVSLHGLVNGEFVELDYKIVTDRLIATSFARSNNAQTVLEQVVKDSGATTKQEQKQACLDYLKKNNLRINYGGLDWLDANIANNAAMSIPDTI